VRRLFWFLNLCVSIKELQTIKKERIKKMDYSKELLLAIATVFVGAGTQLIGSGKYLIGSAMLLLGAGVFVGRGFCKKWMGDREEKEE